MYTLKMLVCVHACSCTFDMCKTSEFSVDTHLYAVLVCTLVPVNTHAIHQRYTPQRSHVSSMLAFLASLVACVEMTVRIEERACAWANHTC